MNFLATFIPEHLAKALGWTIFHSLWQGLIIGLILYVILRIRPNISSQARYIMGVFALAAILISSLFTFFIAYRPVVLHSEFLAFSSTGSTSMGGFTGFTDDLNGTGGRFSEWQQSLTSYFNIISLAWFTGVVILTIRLAGGMMIINRLKKRNVSPLPAILEKKLKGLARRTGLHRSVTFLISHSVKVPSVIGILKPVVLIPSMIISGLPADQLEAIMIHELAHIKRYDFLVNIMQSVIEAVFFFHPVVWIISGNIRTEREKCCDDFTVKVCGKISNYARALASLSEWQVKAPVPSVALNGNNKHILHRVERLIKNKKMKKNKTERILAGMILLVSVLVITLSTGATLKPSGFKYLETLADTSFPITDVPAPLATAEPVTAPEPVTESEPVTALATVAIPAAIATPAAVAETAPLSEPAKVSPVTPPIAPAAVMPVTPPAQPADTSHHHKRHHIDIKDNTVTRVFHNEEGKDQKMKFVIKKGEVKELYVDGKRIPENEFSQYRKEIDKTMEDLRDMEKDLKHARMELDHIDFDQIREDMQIELEHFRQHEMQELHEEMKKLHEEHIKVHLDKEEMRREIEEAMMDVKIDQEKMKEEMHRAQEEMKKAMQEFEDGSHQLSEEEIRQAMQDMERGLAEAQESMAMLEQENMQMIMEEALESVESIDQYKIQQEIEQAMKQINAIDMAEIEKEIQMAMQNMEHGKSSIEEEKKKIDAMIEELEKLELDNP